MSSATGTGRRASSGRGTTRLRWLARRRFDSPVTTYYLLVCVDGGPGRLRADHGAVGVVDRLHRPRRQSAYSIFLEPGRLRGGRRRRRSSSPRGCRCRSGSAWRCRSSSSRSCCSCSCSRPMGVDVNGNRNWLRIGPITVQPSEIIKLGLVLIGGAHPGREAQAPGTPRATCSCPTSCRSPRSASASSCSGHDLGTVLILGAIVAGVLFAAGHPVALVRLRRRRLRRDGDRVRRDQPQPDGPLRRLARAATPTSSAPLASRSTAGTRWPTAAGSASGSAPAARSGACSPSRTTTSSSPSSARSSGCPARSSILAALRRPGAGLLPPRHPHRRPLRAHRDGRHHDLADRPGAHQHRRRHRPAARSSVCRCRWCRRAAPRSSRACSPSASCSPSRAPNPAAPRRCRRDPRPCAARSRSSPASPLAPDALMTVGRAPGRCSSRGAARPGTSRRCSPWPTACAAATPRCRSPRWAPPPGSRPGWFPSAGTRCSRCPRCRSRGDPPATCSGCRPTCAAPCGPPRTPSTAPGPTSSSASVGYVSTPAYLAARRRRHADRRPRAERPPGAGQPARAHGSPPASASPSPAPACRTPPLTGMPLRREIATLDRAAHRAEARARFGLTDAAHACSSPAARSVPSGSTTPSPRRPRRCRRPASRCCTSPGTGKEFVPDAVTGAPYVVLEYCDRMDLAYAAADLVVARSGANTVCELTAVGLPAVYVPLPIGNGEQRLNAAAVVAAGGGLLVDDAAVTPAWVGDVVRPLALDASRLARDGRGRRVGGRARWRRAARRPRRRGRARGPTVTAPHAALRLHRARPAARAARPRAPHRHRRRRDVRRRPAAARRAASRSAAPTPPTAPRWSRCATAVPASHLGHDAGARRRTPTPSSSRRRSATTTSSSRPPAARACASCTAPRPSPRSWAGRAGWPSPAPTARPPPRRCSSSRSSPPGPTPRSPRAARSPSSAPTPRSVTGRPSSSRPTRATARSSPTARTSPSSRTCSPTTSTSTAPARPSSRPTPPSSSPSRDGGLLVACHDDDGSRRLAERARAAGRTVLTYGHDEGADLRVGTVRSHGPRYPVGVRARRRRARARPRGARRPQRPGRLRRLPRRRRRPRRRPGGRARRSRRVRRGPPPLRGARRGRRGHRRRRLRPQPGQGRRGGGHGSRDRPPAPGTGRSASCSSRTCTRAPATSRPTSPQALAPADQVVLLDVYGAREQPVEGVTSALVGDPLRALPGQRTVLVGPTREEAVAALADAARPGDLLLTVGAGDVTAARPAARRGPARPYRRRDAMSLGTTRRHDDHGRRVLGQPFPRAGAVQPAHARGDGHCSSCSRQRWPGCSSGSSAGAPGSAVDDVEVTGVTGAEAQTVERLVGVPVGHPAGPGRHRGRRCAGCVSG